MSTAAATAAIAATASTACKNLLGSAARPKSLRGTMPPAMAALTTTGTGTGLQAVSDGKIKRRNSPMTMIRSKNCAPPPFRERPRGTGLAGFLAGPGTRESKLLRRSTVVRAAASDRPIAAAVAAASGSGLTPVAAAAAAAKISTAAAAAKKTLVRELPGQQQQKPGGAAVEEEENLWHSVGTSSGSVFLADAAMWQSALPELDFTDERFSDDDQSPIAVAAPPTVRDYMTRRPVCVHPRASLKAAAKLMAACAVSGVPVVEPYDDDAGAGADGAGRLVGVLSQRDVLWKETVPYPGEDDLMGEPYEGPMSPSLRAQLGKIRSRTVADAMTAPALFVEAGALLSDAATIMINRNVARLPVVAPREGDKPGMTVVGIITSADILHHTLLSL